MSLRDLERASIREFVEAHADKLTGRVLDYGCGLRPYQDIVEAAGGDYWAHDWWGYPASVVEDTDLNRSCVYYGKWDPLVRQYDAILCTQVLQYVPRPSLVVERFLISLKQGGALVVTGPTNWPWIEEADRWRFTPSGVQILLSRAGFREVEVTERAHVEFEGERWATGWGAVARA